MEQHKDGYAAGHDEKIFELDFTSGIPIHSVAFNKTGTLLAFSYGNKIRLYNKFHEPNKDQLEYIELEGHKAGFSVTSLSFHPRLPFMLSGSEDSTAKVWRIIEKPLSANCIATTQLHERDVITDEKAPHANSHGVSIARTLRYPVLSVAFHPIQPVFITGSASDTVVRQWRFNPDQKEDSVIEPTLLLSNSHAKHDVYCVAFHPVIPFLASCSGKTAKLWNENLQEEPIIMEHPAAVSCLAFHPNPNPSELIMATGCKDNRIRLWRFSQGNPKEAACVATLSGHSKEISSLSFHPDPMKNILATCSFDKTIKLWHLSQNFKEAECIATLDKKDRDNKRILFTSFALYPNTQLLSFDLVTGSRFGNVDLWNVGEKIAHPDTFSMKREVTPESRPTTVADARTSRKSSKSPKSPKSSKSPSSAGPKGGKRRTTTHNNRSHTRRRNYKSRQYSLRRR
jgi:WD40 repeat protein